MFIQTLGFGQTIAAIEIARTEGKILIDAIVQRNRAALVDRTPQISPVTKNAA